MFSNILDYAAASKSQRKPPPRYAPIPRPLPFHLPPFPEKRTCGEERDVTFARSSPTRERTRHSSSSNHFAPPSHHETSPSLPHSVLPRRIGREKVEGGLNRLPDAPRRRAKGMAMHLPPLHRPRTPPTTRSFFPPSSLLSIAFSLRPPPPSSHEDSISFFRRALGASAGYRVTPVFARSPLRSFSQGAARPHTVTPLSRDLVRTDGISLVRGGGGRVASRRGRPSEGRGCAFSKIVLTIRLDLPYVKHGNFSLAYD